MVVNFMKKIYFGYLKKWSKSHNKIINLEVENFEHLRKLVLTSYINLKKRFSPVVL